ncbi:MAG TPA: hypothetical protein VOA41_15730 [Candidatus Dormibacteraeota bacterium]|nr:hypothetical protein [Candidatus Dormibacteraeota bacterium]
MQHLSSPPAAPSLNSGKLRPMPQIRKAQTASMPAIPAAAVRSFLKDTRGALNWTLYDLTATLKLNTHDARQVIAILQIQGYIKPAHETLHWITTPAGEVVSCSKSPRFTRESIEQALDALSQRIKAFNQDPDSPFKVRRAAAFGDFLMDRQRLQSPDVGIDLVRNNSTRDAARPNKSKRGKLTHEERDSKQGVSAKERSRQRAVLKKLRAKTQLVHIQLYQDWMSSRSHRILL